MKTKLYILLTKLGYKVENKKKEVEERRKIISKFEVKHGIDLLVKSFVFVQNLSQKFPEIQFSDYEEGVLVEFQSLKIYVETYEELFILDEVFVQNEYNFLTKEKVTVIDIGANIGSASLFFATLSNVVDIHAFEPVLETYIQAKENIERNNFSSKVNLYNFGLGKNNRMETFLFDKNIKGNTGVRAEKSTSFKKENVIETQVEIKNTSETINQIIENCHYKIMLKVDCEGGEYEIFENLSNSGLINKIDYIMMEWHDKGAEELEKVLYENSFITFSKRLAFNSGMIYAVKK